VPVIVARGWSEAQCRQYTIDDNKLSAMSSWDENLLQRELSELSLLDADLSATALTEREINKLLGPGAGGDGAADVAPKLEGLSYSIVIRSTEGERNRASCWSSSRRWA
jgi:hypothetical protein